MLKITSEEARQQADSDHLTKSLYQNIKALMLQTEPCPDGTGGVGCVSCQALVVAAYVADTMRARDEAARLAQ
ncbi:MAG: hypothetical protein ACOYB3_01870 [Azonexus sp.]